MHLNEWLETELQQNIFTKKYMYQNESLDEFFNRTSNGNENIKRLMIEKKFLFAGRTLANRNTHKEASYSNCYSSGYAPDSVEGIMDLCKNMALTYKAQGGQGVSLSKIRPKDTGVKHNTFKSDGIIPFMELLNQTTASISQGGCIYENEKVLTDKGYIPIKSINIGNKVWTKKGWIKVNHVFNKGVKPVYEITTNKGYKIKTTLDHKFAYDGFNTKELSKFNIGDNVNLISFESYLNTNINYLPDGTELTSDIAYFLGYFNGNGYVNSQLNGGTLTMHYNQLEIFDKLSNILLNLGFHPYTSEVKLNSYRRLYLNKDIIDWLKINKLIKNKTKNISIPSVIFVSNTNIIEAYISGSIDSDGSVYQSSFKYATISKDYAYEYQLLLQMLGYLPSLHKQIRDKKQDLYEINDSFRPNQIVFNSSIKYNNKNSINISNTRYSTPYTLNNLNIKASDTNVKRLKKISYNLNIGLHSYLQILNKPYATLIFDSIKSIEFIGELPVYDISLVDEHLFMCNGIYVSNSRKGALMMSLDCWHKEIIDFINIKSKLDSITKANLSVEIDNEFMNAVIAFYTTGEIITKTITRNYEGNEVTYEIVPIDVFNAMVERAYDWAEPGVIFVDEFRNYNLMENDDDYMVITGNPCSEQPLPKDGACNLGSINLSEYVLNPYTENPQFDYVVFINDVSACIKAMDDVIDEGSQFHALQSQIDMSTNYRNIGLGVMGIGEMLIKLNITYGSGEAIELLDNITYHMFRTAVKASNQLAYEKGTFPKYTDKVFDSTIMHNHFSVQEIEELKQWGLRNCSLLSIAPTGSIGTMFNISGGIEPVFAIKHTRKTESLHKDKDQYYDVFCKSAEEYMSLYPNNNLPQWFVEAEGIPWGSRIDMQAVAQKSIDTAISSTINLPNNATIDDIAWLFITAWEKKLKGCTVYRSGCKREGILTNCNNENINLENNNKNKFILPRGFIEEVPKDLTYRKYKLRSGCGNVYFFVGVDEYENKIYDCFTNTDGQGGCTVNTIANSRLLSASLRGGVPIQYLIQQLEHSGSCPAYQNVRGRQTGALKIKNMLPEDIDISIISQINEYIGKPLSNGKSCASAFSYILKNICKEFENEEHESLSYTKANKNEILNNEYTECTHPNQKMVEGCSVCPDCGYSKCS